MRVDDDHNTRIHSLVYQLVEQQSINAARYNEPNCASVSCLHPSGTDGRLCAVKGEGKGRPYSITERRVPEVIPVLGSQPAGDVSHKLGVGCHYFPPGLQLPPQPLRGLLPISLLGEQRHDGCEQFA